MATGLRRPPARKGQWMPQPEFPAPKLKKNVSVLLTYEQAASLDELTAAILHRYGKSISRSALIRAILEAVLPYSEQLHRCASEGNVTFVLSRQLERGKQERCFPAPNGV